jgi:cardiolipin synthase
MEKHHLSELLSIFQELPLPILQRLIAILNIDLPVEEKIRIISSDFNSSPCIKRLIRLIEEKQVDAEDVSLVFGAIQTYRENDPKNRITLAWSGPNLRGVPMRKTAQVIIEMIDDAKTSLFLSSFSFYKAKDITDHLVLAAARGVSISLLLETPQSSHNKINKDPLKHLDDELKKKAHIYIWPYKNRIVDGDDQTGSLHAKFVLQDKVKLFISSANLTQSAMDRNIELGVIIEDQAVVCKFNDHLDNLISENIITRL